VRASAARTDEAAVPRGRDTAAGGGRRPRVWRAVRGGARRHSKRVAGRARGGTRTRRRDARAAGCARGGARARRRDPRPRDAAHGGLLASRAGRERAVSPATTPPSSAPSLRRPLSFTPRRDGARRCSRGMGGNEARRANARMRQRGNSETTAWRDGWFATARNSSATAARAAAVAEAPPPSVSTDAGASPARYFDQREAQSANGFGQTCLPPKP